MELNDKQEKFCQLYFKTNNATQSYLAAGYKVSPKVAESAASRLLSNVKVQKRIQQLRARAAKRFEISMDKLIEANARLAFASLKNSVEIKDGRVKLKDDADLDQLDGLSFSESITDKGISKALSVKLPDRIKALQELAKLTGAYDSKSKSNDDDGTKKSNADTILDALARVIENRKD
jgi:phage terminase small subunit